MYILFPTHYLSHPSGVLVGWNSPDAEITCIVCVTSASLASKVSPELGSVLGSWSNDDCDDFKRNKTRSLLVLRKVEGTDLPEVYSNHKEVIVLLYSQPPKYSFLADKPLNLNATKPANNTSDVSEPSLRLPELAEWQNWSRAEAIIDCINSTREAEKAIQLHINQEQKTSTLGCSWILSIMLWILSKVDSVPSFITSLSGHGFFKWQVVEYLLSLPLIFHHSSMRISQMRYLYSVMGSCIRKRKSSSAVTKQPKNYTKSAKKSDPKELHERQRTLICSGNFIAGVLLDIIFGVVIVVILNSNNSIERITTAILENTENLAKLLSQLLHWMTGVPAGLKLNTQLAEFLRKFFLYHIYLWQTYLKTIQPYLQTIIWASMLSGCLGLTFLVSLASDVFSVLTIHIYCFYVYAARLYSLQVYGITSLARLFTGKKHNILRSRVDSLPHDVDRLFAGTLLFTVLFFLLPTTTLFYVVFTSLRLFVLIIKSLLSRAICALNKLPLFGLALSFCKPSLLPGGLQLDIKTFKESHCKDPMSPLLPPQSSALFVRVCNKPLPLSKLFDWSLGDNLSRKKPGFAEPETWGSFVGKLLKGHLIYPWIKKS